MATIGDLYRVGQGVPVDYAKAMKWYRKGAAAGSRNAMVGLAIMYHYGLGVAKNPPKAAKWAAAAAHAPRP